ncbi:MAG: 2'-5' RNA ligase [Motiliproteus sp.]|jgi:2'-5' RNA ligase
MTIRSFLAVPLKSAAVRRLANYADTLCGLDTRGQVRWSDSNSYHLTLCFLGEITLEQIARLESQLRLNLESHSSFQLHLDRVGYLQVNPELAMLAALSASSFQLKGLQQQIAEIAVKLRLPLDQSYYQPHVTLGRLAVGPATQSPQSWPPLDQASLVDSVVLYQSRPGATGSVYTPLFDIALSAEGLYRQDSVAEPVGMRQP